MRASNVKVITPGIHRLTVIVSLLALVAGLLLFLFPFHTDVFFAWTVLPPLTAACLGGTYLTAMVVSRMAARETIWSNARGIFPGMLLSTGLILITTFQHLDKFHFAHAALMARFAAWSWVIFYGAAPFVMLALIILQLRTPGKDLLPQEVPPTGYRAALFSEGLLLMLIGAALFIAPQTAILFWPWKLTALTAQVIGAWSFGIGFALGQAVYENAWERIRTSLWGNIVMGVLQLISVARFASTLDWGTPAVWLYAIFCFGMIVIGAVGWTEMWSKTTLIG